MLVDSHCHLDFPEFAPELDAVVSRASEAGVMVCVTIGTTLAKFPAVRAVAERFKNVWCTVGVHPHEAAKEPLDSPQKLLAEAQHSKVVGIGETGLDYFYEHSPRGEQLTNFRIHISAAREAQLPVIIHTRSADEETIDVLRDEMKNGAFSGLIHCFTGGRMLAEAAVELGLYISASGIATFKNSQALRDIIADVPLERLLVETDAPFLAPVPVRGKRNEPAFVAHTARMLADLKGLDLQTMAQATTENFFRLFTKVRRP